MPNNYLQKDKFVWINKISAFTLAEVLITLSIIGIIASMTIPSLVQDVQEAQYKATWKKTYSDINQVTKRIMIDNAGNMTTTCNDNNCIRDTYSKYLNSLKKCDIGQSSGNCWSTNWKRLNDHEAWTVDDQAGIVQSNGSFLLVNYSSMNCTQKIGSLLNRCGSIHVDINGFKGPNKIGKDIFLIHVLKNSIKPYGVEGDHIYNLPWYDCVPSGDGERCSSKFLYQ